MGSYGSTSEIVELNNDFNLGGQFSKLGIEARKLEKDDDLSQLMRLIELRHSSRVSGSSHRDINSDKHALKKPVKVGTSQASGIGLSEPVTLKQSLRKLCVSQASEMAATKKKLSKPNVSSSDDSEAGTIKRLLASVVVPSSESEVEKGNSLDFSPVAEKVFEISKSSNQVSPPPKVKVKIPRIQDVIAESTEELPSIVEKKKIKGKFISNKNVTYKPMLIPHLIKPAVKKKRNVKKKEKQEELIKHCKSCNTVSITTTKNIKTSCDTDKDNNASAGPPVATPNNCQSSILNSKVREKGESSQSSKTSIDDRSTSTSIISNDSHHNSSGGNGSRPHMSKDVRWKAIHNVTNRQNQCLGLSNFRLLRRLGCGDIGTVYLAELSGSDCMFALKVMDVEFLIHRKKMLRAQTERDILQMLDHPFLPTLYANFTTDNLSCLVMEYCPGGDLHVLRQRQPGRYFSESAARFYVAEVLLALEYLHMLGVIYRDLKPENILVREDGHIMLSDFDLSLRCQVSPTLLQPSPTPQQNQNPTKRPNYPCPQNECIEPICLQQSCTQPFCFTPRLNSTTKSQNAKTAPLPQLIVEPAEARSNSFVGTHEYLAPEIIRGDGHGSAVDWWMLGVFLYELLYGRTPFKGSDNDETLANVITESLKFPDCPCVSVHARDLIKGLLVKEPENRLGSNRGAAAIKQHPFFKGMNWALIRCASPPEVPKCFDVVCNKNGVRKAESLDFGSYGDDDIEFELF